MSPIYQFSCKEHGSFETWQGMSEDHTEVCPICKQPANRVFTNFEMIGSLPTLNRAKAMEIKPDLKATEMTNGKQ